MTINKTRSFLYTLARLLGDLAALFKGPDGIARRAGRRVAGKLTGRTLWKIFK